MAGYITDNMDTLVRTAAGLTKKCLQEYGQEPAEITQREVLIGLFDQFERTGRLAAEGVATRHPDFQGTAQIVKDNTPILLSTTGEAFTTRLSNELNVIVPFYEKAGYSEDPDYLSLLAAYIGWGFKDQKDTFDAKMQEFFDFLDSQKTLSERATVNLIMAMWFWDYDGFQDRVVAACAQPALRPDGFIAKNFDSLAATACGIAGMSGQGVTRETVQMEIFRHFLAEGRNALSKEIAAQHPEFLPVAQTIEDDTRQMINLPGEQFAAFLDKEMNMLMEVYASADWYDESDFVALFLAYACWGFKDRKAEVANTVQQLFDSIDRHETLSGGAKLDLIIALWMWDYHGFQDRVVANTSQGGAAASQNGAAPAAPAPDGYIAQKMDALVDLVINLAKQEGADFTQQSIGDMLNFDWLSKRQSIAQVIAGKHPVFNTFVQKVAADDLIITNPASSPEAMRGALEQEAMQVAECNSQSELAQDVDFVSLLLVFTCWVYKDNKEEYKDATTPFFAVLDAQSEQSPASLTNLVTALWLWNYDNFQGRIMQRIQELVSQYQEEQKQVLVQRQKYRMMGVCQYCGGTFKGVLSKKCSACGRPKDY